MTLIIFIPSKQLNINDLMVFTIDIITNDIMFS